MAQSPVDPAQADKTQKTTKINLSNDVTVNGVRYKAGKGVEVPARSAEDIERIDYDHNKYLQNLNRKNVYEVDAGTIGVGGGE